MKKTGIRELRSFSKEELTRYVQYVEREPLRVHHAVTRTYICELRLKRVNKRYDATVKKLSALTQCPKTLQELGEWTEAHGTVSRCIADLERVGGLLYGQQRYSGPLPGGDYPFHSSPFALRASGLSRTSGRGPETVPVGCEDGQGRVLWTSLSKVPVVWGRESMLLQRAWGAYQPVLMMQQSDTQVQPGAARVEDGEFRMQGT